MNTMHAIRVGAAALAVWSVLATSGLADNKGQADLDKAIELQLRAQTLADFENVADLCEQALDKGLDDENKKFARELLASTLLEHARRLASTILEQQAPNPRWPAIRNNAVRDLDRLLRHQPNTAEAHYMRARLLLLPGGDPAEARKAADFAVKEFQKDEDAKESLAQALLLRAQLATDPAARLADIDASIKADPESIDGYQARAGHYLATGEIDKGIADLKKIVDDHAELLPARFALVQAYVRAEKYDDAHRQIDEIIKLRDDLPSIHQLRAQVYSQQKKYDAAVEALDAALEIDPRNTGAMFMRAEVNSQREAWDDALADLERILKAQPGQPQALLLRAGVYAEQKKFGDSIKDLNELLRRDPDNVQIKVQAASFYVAGGWPRTAIRHLTAVLRDDPGNWMALRARGDAYLNIGKHAEAIADLARANEAHPDNAGILNNLSWVLSTTPDDKLRDGKRALELAKKACELTQHKMPHILSTLASAYAEEGDFETAIMWSTKGVEMSAKDEERMSLAKELESYRQKKAWREQQEQEDKPNPPVLFGDKDQL